MKYTKNQIVEMTALWLDEDVLYEEWCQRTEKFGGGGQEERLSVAQSVLDDAWNVDWMFQWGWTP